MIKLNLPEYAYKLSKVEGRIMIFDPLRKKHLVLTPEEWVRQHFVNYLVTELKYPKALIRLEGGLSYNQLQKRSDIVVFDRDAKPWMVIECKAPDQILSNETLHQASTYNATLRAKFLVVTNGLSHFFFSTDWSSGVVQSLNDLPTYPGSL
ncbi:type I restriction enzyme HsdR N-terminal domain-containing protein [Pseudochryseolinea flava]|uniref:Restriction endonuclease subunit R n=1 Tax=Pseudochryseolinea flava TaxID=2059302 RepID=A0A364XXK7_9BACT|nr:type I restriction enzyme HsdR N-terminal domain-containing protein [Pseudochryseolinea flava]RAV99178.1 restriction endonuclease subunit R [Pseudochryseolinea flava]